PLHAGNRHGRGRASFLAWPAPRLKWTFAAPGDEFLRRQPRFSEDAETWIQEYRVAESRFWIARALVTTGLIRSLPARGSPRRALSRHAWPDSFLSGRG